VTDDEWDGCCFLMEQAFKGDMDEDKRDAYRVFLEKFSSEQVVAALQVLAEESEPWLPAVPEIVQACRKLEQADHGGEVPGWAEVYPMLIRALHVHVGYFESDAEKTATCVAWLEKNSHPVVAKFFEAQGYDRLSRMEVDDPEHGALRQKDLREMWEQFVEVAKQRLATGLALQSVGRRACGPRSLDQAALLASAGAPLALEAGDD
jgi:hypothetical protein